MKTIIVEDETVAVKNMLAIISEIDADIEIVGVFDSVTATINYLREKDMPELIFLDIHLADGNSFSIFKQIEITCPVIFTTAYDNYAIDAFKVNSIDYLLKPIEPDHVKRALQKLKRLSNVDQGKYAQHINKVISTQKQYTRTLLVSYRDKLMPIPVDQIAFVYTRNESTKIVTSDGQSLRIDKTLETLMSVLDPTDFFRANRQFIIAHHAVKDVVVWFNNRLSVNLKLPTQERIIISKARVSTFKQWLQKN
jgi:two-component system LytT family response regulator